MVKFGGIHGERMLGVRNGDVPRESVVRNPQDPWSPPSLTNESETRKLRTGLRIEDLLPNISARSMRLTLYRGLTESGASALDSIGVNVEWTGAVLYYSGMQLLDLAGEARGMKVYGGYDPRLVEYALRAFDRKVEDNVFRIYARTAETARDIVKNSEILASHRGYISETKAGLEHFEDLTGVFITRPGVAPKRVGISGYEHFVDFRLSPAVQRLRIKGQPEYLIPGPPRLSREEMDQARAVIAGELEIGQGPADVVELMRMFPGGLPRFAIPIEVAGSGRLLGISPAGVNPAMNTNSTGSALIFGGFAGRTSIQPTLSLPTILPRF